MVEYSKFENLCEDKLGKYEEPISQDYKVYVNGEETPVYTCRVSKHPYNLWWVGQQRPFDQSELSSYVNIISDEAIDIEVVVNYEYKDVMIRPYSKGVEFTDEDGKVKFTLKENGQYVFACDDLHNSLYIFNSKPITCDAPSSVTHYFGPGIHFTGKVTLKSNESVYVDKDALVYGCIYAENAENIHIYGNGVFDDSGEERFTSQCYENYTNGNIKFYDCKNVKIEGIGFKNSAIWCVNLFHCFDVVIDNIKVFGQWRYNTDGVDIVNCQDILLKNSFIHSFDDSVTIKGIDRYIGTDNANITTDNCVLWCDWGKTCEIGLETACREYKNIVFKNCDIIRGGNTFLDIQNGDCAEVHDIVFENINAEYNHCDEEPALQESYDKPYIPNGRQFLPYLILVINPRFREVAMYSSDFKDNLVYKTNLEGIKYASIHDITYRNINVWYNDKIIRPNGKPEVKLYMENIVDDAEFYNIKIYNVNLNGKPITKDDFNITIKNADGFIFE